MTHTIAEPAVRADGPCAKCGKRRHPERSRKYGAHAGELDPFCSRACCENWHGIEGAGVEAEEFEEAIA